jgi:hypothetical protein
MTAPAAGATSLDGPALPPHENSNPTTEPTKSTGAGAGATGGHEGAVPQEQSKDPAGEETGALDSAGGFSVAFAAVVPLLGFRWRGRIARAQEAKISSCSKSQRALRRIERILTAKDSGQQVICCPAERRNLSGDFAAHRR